MGALVAAAGARVAPPTPGSWTRLYNCCHRPSGRLLEPGGGGSVAVASFLRYAALHGGCYNPGRCEKCFAFLDITSQAHRCMDTNRGSD